MKPDLGVNPAKGRASGRLGKKIDVLIFHIKKLKNNPCGYKLKDYFKRFFYPILKRYYLILLS